MYVERKIVRLIKNTFARALAVNGRNNSWRTNFINTYVAIKRNSFFFLNERSAIGGETTVCLDMVEVRLSFRRDRRTFSPSHPPVVVKSSMAYVPEEQAGLAEPRDFVFFHERHTYDGQT